MQTVKCSTGKKDWFIGIYVSIFLKDLNLTESNTRQFSLDRMQIGGRWMDDIVANS